MVVGDSKVWKLKLEGEKASARMEYRCGRVDV